MFLHPPLFSWRKATDLAPYTEILKDAIESYPGQQAYLCEIYEYLETNFECFRNAPDHRWRNSVRHNLSIHDEFQRVVPKEGERRRQLAEAQSKGAAGFWTVANGVGSENLGPAPRRTGDAGIPDRSIANQKVPRSFNRKRSRVALTPAILLPSARSRSHSGSSPENSEQAGLEVPKTATTSPSTRLRQRGSLDAGGSDADTTSTNETRFEESDAVRGHAANEYTPSAAGPDESLSHVASLLLLLAKNPDGACDLLKQPGQPIGLGAESQ